MKEQMNEQMMQELVPIVISLAQKYTMNESSSITYEKADQLMGAVIYCIREFEKQESMALTASAHLTAEEIYTRGVEAVENKVRDTLQAFNQLRIDFRDYGNMFLRDTVQRGMPEFFRRYDARFAPQNTLLTLDYPVLRNQEGLSGIDRISCYLECIRYEQTFLKELPDRVVNRILTAHDPSYRTQILNICECVLQNMLGHLLAGVSVNEPVRLAKIYRNTAKAIRSMDAEELILRLEAVIDQLTEAYYDGDLMLGAYLKEAARPIAVRFKAAAENFNLHHLF